jgi:hypothetical protein
MCWNAEVSINTFVFAVLSFIIGYSYGFPIRKLVFMLVFSCIQLVEYFLWKNLNNSFMNSLFSKIGFFVILLETLFSLNLIQNDIIRKKLIYFYLFITFVFLTFNYKYFNFSTSVGTKGFLNWHWLKSFNTSFILFFTAWTLLFFIGLFLSGDYVMFAFGIFTFAYSWFNRKKNDTFGTHWCSISNAVWLYVLIWVLKNN